MKLHKQSEIYLKSLLSEDVLSDNKLLLLLDYARKSPKKKYLS